MIISTQVEKIKDDDSSSDQSDEPIYQIKGKQDSKKISLKENSQQSNIRSYFKDLHLQKPTQKSLKLDRKYSQNQTQPYTRQSEVYWQQKKQSIQIEFHHHNQLGIEVNKTAEPSYGYPETNQSNYDIQNILKIIQKNNLNDLKQIEENIYKNGFTKSQFFTNDLLILDISHSKHYEIVTLQIQISYYKTKVQILNSFLNDHIHTEGDLIGYGAFGNVYFLRFLHQNYAVKCIRFNSTDQFDIEKTLADRQRVFITALRQYFFLLLFSAMQIGPKMHKIMGFDLILTSQCIQFSAQLCFNKEINLQDAQKLRNSLKKMHSLKIVHRDIKPDNIMYSESFKKHVFIDFGGCLFLQQKIGNRTFTNFLGTAGFCTEEMFNLLGKSNKSYIDLYYNDLFCLNRSFQRYKQFSKNMVQGNITIDKENTLKIIKNWKNPYCLLNFIKYLIYNKNYNDFLLYWRMMQKRHLNQLEDIQAQLLRFFMDIEPNQVLREFYWKNIEQTVRSQQQFLQLYQIFSNELTDSLSTWIPIHSKQKKFQPIIQFFCKIAINYGNFSQKQKQLKRMMKEKNRIEKFIFQKKSFIPDLQISSQNKNFLKQDFFKQTDLQSYFLVVVNYCSFSQNKYNADIAFKIKASQLANQIIESLFCDQYQKINQTFVCSHPEIKPLVKMFQYFLFYFWQNIPKIFKENSLSNCLSSLFLLGYPTYLHESKHNLGFYIMKDKNSNRVQKIVRFWQFNLIQLNFGNLFYDRNYDNFICRPSSQKKIQIQRYYKEVMSPESVENDEFFKLNYLLFTKIYLNHEKLNQISLKNIFQKLEKDEEFTVISRQQLERWKIIMRIILVFLASAYQINFQYLDFTSVDCYNKAVLSNDRHRLPYLFTIPLTKYQVWSSYKKLGEILKIIDRIVNYEKISLRYFTNCRILLAYRLQDFEKLKILIDLVLKTTENFSVLNMFVIHEQLMVVKQLVSHEVKKINFVNFTHEKSIFDPIIERGLSIGCFFSDIKNKLNPLRRLQQGHYKNMKNVLMVVSTLHILLQNLKTIFQDFIELNQRKRNSYIFMKKQNHFKSQREKCYQKNLQKTKQCLFNIVTNIDLKTYVSHDRDSINQYVSHLMNYYITERQFQKAEQLFESQFGQLTTQQDEDEQKVKPVITSYIIYCILKTRQNRQDNYWEQRLLDIYYRCKQNNYGLDPMKNPFFFKSFFTSMIYCQRSFQEIEGLLVYLTQNLGLSPTKANAEKFNYIIESRLRCTCSECLTKPYKNWVPSQFISFLQERIPMYLKVKYSYMAVIFYLCLQNKDVSLKSKKKFINFIRKSFSHLSYPVRSIVTHRLHWYSLSFYNAQFGLNKYFLQFKQKMDSYPKITREESMKKQAQFLSHLKTKFSQKIIKKHLYFYSKYIKNHNQFHTLVDTVERQFFYKQKLLSNWFIPQRIKQMYQTKLMKYHFIRQNYRQTHTPSQEELLMARYYFQQ